MGNFFKDVWDMGTTNTNFDPYAPVGALKQAGGQIADAAKSPGYDTAAQGAREAQQYLQALSQQAWDRQMQGLQGAMGSFQNYDALSAQMNPRHGGPIQGGGGGGGGMPSGGGGGGPAPTDNPVNPPGSSSIFDKIAQAAFKPGGIGDKLQASGQLPQEHRPDATGFQPPPPNGGTTGFVPPPRMGQPAPAPLPPPQGAPVPLPPPGSQFAPAPLPPPPGADQNALAALAAMAAPQRAGRGWF